jgi:hypothetical protein
MAVIVARDLWLTAVDAARRLGVGLPALKTAAPLLGIRARLIPGRRGAKYHAGDVEAALRRLDEQEAEVIAAARESLRQPPRRSGRRGAKERETARAVHR